MHGVFDSDDFRRWFINRMRARKGLASMPCSVASYDLDPAFDKLADMVRNSVDLKKMYQAMGL